MHSTLVFSEPFLTVQYVQNVDQLALTKRTIVLNTSDHGLLVQGKTLHPWNSAIYSNVTIEGATNLICVHLDIDLLSIETFPYASVITRDWTHIYDILQLPHLKETMLWRSAKERIGDIEVNLWYAAPRTHCGIHNKHNSRELHTQVFGIGRMQKFHANDYNTLYQEVFMSPGYTHDPFYFDAAIYPWHQYYADTDCIWLAVEF